MFWDSSAVVPLLVADTQSAALSALMTTDREPTLWWGSPVECLSALYRRHRKQPLPQAALSGGLDRLRALVEHLDTIIPSDDVRRRAGRLVATHPLSAADAFQLGAALIWCEEQPAGETFVSLDERLREAARREGFKVLPDDR
jgi:uncharacterized protein